MDNNLRSQREFEYAISGAVKRQCFERVPARAWNLQHTALFDSAHFNVAYIFIRFQHGRRKFPSSRPGKLTLVNVSSKIVYGNWPHGGSVCYLVFKSNQQFRAVDGEIVQPGVYRIVQCAVVGRDVTIPLIASIPTTTDSSDPSATWTTYFEDSSHTQKMDWLKGFQLNHVNTSPVSWATIFDDNNPQGINVPSGGISRDQVVLLIRELADQIAGNTVATGIGTLAINEEVTILTPHVTADSPIRLIPRTEAITGNLRAFNRVAGVSFMVVSDNGADSGNFRWEIL